MSDITRNDVMIYIADVFTELRTVAYRLSNRISPESEPELYAILKLINQFIVHYDQNYKNAVESLSIDGFYEYYNKICQLSAVLILFMPFMEGGIEKERLHDKNLVSQVFLGNYHKGDVTGEGILLQVIAGVLGLDALTDVLNTVHNITNWEWTLEHTAETAFNLASIFPLLGVLTNLVQSKIFFKGTKKAAAEKAAKELAEKLSKEAKEVADEVVEQAVKKSDDAIEVAEKAAKYTDGEIERIITEIGSSVKKHPLRIDYENEVVSLDKMKKLLEVEKLELKEIATKLHQARRDIGVKYKDLTPELLREYIYEMNKGRYKGDPLGGSFEFFYDRYKYDKLKNIIATDAEVYQKIISGATRPNEDINKLLGGFKKWLEKNII